MRVAGRRATAFAAGIAGALALGGLSFSSLGCFSPKIDDGDFACAATEPRCPPDFTCASDNRCRKGGGGGGDASIVDGAPSDTMGSFEAVLVVTPMVDLSDIVFGTTVMTPSRATIRNTGTGPSGSIALNLLGADMGAFRLVNDMCSNRVLMPNDTCVFDVTNVPTALVGAKMAMIRVIGQAGMPHDMMVKSNVVSIITVAPMSFDFGTTSIGMASATTRFQFTNTNTAIRAEMLMVRITGPGANEFKIMAGMDFCTGTNLSPGTVCNVTVFFQPTTGGSHTASLILTSNPGGGAAVALTGRTP